MRPVPRTRARQLWLIAMWTVALVASWLVMRWRSEPTPEIRTTPITQTASEAAASLATLAPTRVQPYRLNVRRTGRSHVLGPTRPVVRWKRDLGARVTAQPVLDASGNIYVGTHAGALWALNSEGITVWQRELGARIYAAALVTEGGDIYVGTDGRGLFALDSKGKTRFVVDTQADADTAPTLAADGSLRVAAGHSLFALSREGKTLWRYDAADKIFSSPSVDDASTTYIGVQDGHVLAIDATGELKFRYKTGGDVDVSPLLDGDALYVGSDDQHVYCLGLNGTLRWATRLDGYVRGALALGADDTLLATHSGPRGALVALDRRTGDKRFRFAFTLTESTDTGTRSGALVDVSGGIYTGSDDDFLYALSPRGELRWALPTGSDVEASTVLAADGTLYVVSAAGVLYAIGGNE